ncbi:MAG: hypothetical protein HYR91_07500 [Flavobacteriia bacterium]|nr:hypothetical protein [Flavobacteriia bacterium]
MFKIFCFFLLFLVYSCQEKKEEIIDLNEIMPSSERYKEGSYSEKKKEKELSFYDTLQPFYQTMLDSLMIPVDKINLLYSKDLPDRFEVKNSLKMVWNLKNDSVNFYHWNFKDSSKTLNAFYNWMDCYGEKCKSIKVGSIINFQKRPFLLLVREKDLFFIDATKKINPETWIKTLNNTIKKPYWKYVISQTPKGKAKWETIKDTIHTEIKTIK